MFRVWCTIYQVSHRRRLSGNNFRFSVKTWNAQLWPILDEKIRCLSVNTGFFGDMKNDAEYMKRALELAHEAEVVGEVPVGAVLVLDGKIIAEGYNQPIISHDPSAHAEMVALRKAGLALNNYRLLETTLYVTLEPCAMCMGAILHARVKRLVFGAWDPRAGAVQSVFQIPAETRLNHRIDWQVGVLENECSEILKQFFKRKR